jgi:hypothetical protein
MGVETELARIEAQLRQVEALIAEGDEKLGRRAPKVSGWSVGEQVDHILKVLDRSLGLLLTSDQALPKGINLTGRLLLALRRLPRGVAKSPAALRGAERPAGELREQASRIPPLLAKVREDPARFARPTPVYPHPYFGGLDAARAVRFLAVHTDHHLRIVADIRRATGA